SALASAKYAGRGTPPSSTAASAPYDSLRTPVSNTTASPDSVERALPTAISRIRGPSPFGRRSTVKPCSSPAGEFTVPLGKARAADPHRAVGRIGTDVLGRPHPAHCAASTDRVERQPQQLSSAIRRPVVDSDARLLEVGAQVVGAVGRLEAVPILA